MKNIILCDFDGTITRQDTLVSILDKFAGPKWRAIEKRILKEGFGNRLGLKQEFALCDPKKATKEQIARLLNDKIDIDPYFEPFLEFCGREGYEFVIVSGGFSLCIDAILKKYNLGSIPYYSNKLLFPRINHTINNSCGTPQNEASAGKKNKLEIENPYSNDDCKLCGNCKTMHLRRYRALGYYIIYIGDSTTDRCPVKYADIAFTKSHLTDYCAKENIPHLPYDNFSDIHAYLSKNIPIIDEEIEENIGEKK